ncbi:MAG TPA: shikimate kinase [Candidatus Obscuribacterales bacterium]
MTVQAILIGPPGSGKSTVGRLLAKRLRARFMDSDREIERREKLTVPEIFKQKGEEHFRFLERQFIVELAKREAEPASGGIVLSVGGGLPVYYENMTLLLSLGPVVFLSASPAQLTRRINSNQDRPLLSSAQSEGRAQLSGRLEKLLCERQAVYARAHHTVETDKLSVSEVVDAIYDFLAL